MLKTYDCIDVHLVRKKISPERVTVRDSGPQGEQTVVLSEEVEVEE